MSVLTDILFGANFKEFVSNVIFGIVLAWIVPYVNVLLSELRRQNLFNDGAFIRFLIYSLFSIPFAMIMVLLGVRTKFLTCLGIAFVIMSFVNRDKIRQNIQPIVKWFAMRKYKQLMKPTSVWYEIRASRNKYCLKEWLDDGWKLPNGSPLCEDKKRFHEDLTKVISECTTEGLQDWQVTMVCDCGYKFRNM